MPDPLDLDAIRIWAEQITSAEDSLSVIPTLLRCLTVIEALRKALQHAITDLVPAKDRCEMLEAALALVKGGET